ncbi:MAG TPA: TonB-dependent receptor plug domain-containing protein [Gemmatimonadaceae bacterium]
MQGSGSRAPRAFTAYVATLALVACSYGGATGATRPAEPLAGAADSLPADADADAAFTRQQRGTVTGAVSAFDIADRSRRPHVRSLADLLQGRIAGLSVETTRGGGVSMSVRGAGAALSGGDPLVIVDGDPLPSVGPVFSGFLASIDPADVVRVVVLKDASSTAVYGTRGRNGVVLITLRHAGQ